MAPDPLTPTPAVVTPVPSATAASSPPPPPPTRDFKKISLRQTARKFTARPPPPRRPWPKPNYYCDYDSHGPITSSLFSSDVVFSKSVVQSLFFNTRYDKDYNISTSNSVSASPSCSKFVNGTCKSGNEVQNGQVDAEDDDDIQIIAHIKPKLGNKSSNARPWRMVELTSSALASGLEQQKMKTNSAKSAKPRRSRPKPTRAKKDLKDRLKDPLSLIHTNNADFTASNSKTSTNHSRAPPNKMKTDTPPKKRQRLNNKTQIGNGVNVNGHTSDHFKKGMKNVSTAIVTDTEISTPPVPIPNHLWSLPSLAWTQSQSSTPLTATKPVSVSPARARNIGTATTPGPSSQKVTNGKIAESGKKRQADLRLHSLQSKSKSVHGRQGAASSNSQNSKKARLMTTTTSLSHSSPVSAKQPAHAHVLSTSAPTKNCWPKSKIRDKPFIPNLNPPAASVADVHVPKVPMPNHSKTSMPNNVSNTKAHVALCTKGAAVIGMPIRKNDSGSGKAKVEEVQVISERKVGKVNNDKNNNTFNHVKTGTILAPFDYRPTKQKIDISRVQKQPQQSKQLKINGIFKVAKKNRINTNSTTTANWKSNNKPSQIPIKVQSTSTQALGARLNSELKVKSKPSPTRVHVNGTAIVSPSQMRNPKPPLTPTTTPTRHAAVRSLRNNVTASPGSGCETKSIQSLPLLKDTRIMCFDQPMITEDPINYSLKSLLSKEKTPERDKTNGMVSGEQKSPFNPTPSSTRQLRTTPTKSYAHLTKRSCPCNCSKSH